MNVILQPGCMCHHHHDTTLERGMTRSVMLYYGYIVAAMSFQVYTMYTKSAEANINRACRIFNYHQSLYFRDA